MTPKERQIAELARDRLSNPEIGGRLFLSPRTVEWHLRKVYTKLGKSRQELSTALVRASSHRGTAGVMRWSDRIDYRAPSEVPGGTVLVVGGGNTGYQIASELSAIHRVHLAVGGRQAPLPQTLLGRDLFWWLVTTRLLKTTVKSRLGRKLSGRDTLIGSSPRTLKRHGVEAMPRVMDASERTVSFADGTELSIDAVIWATGFGLDHASIDAPIFDAEHEILHQRGVTASPGLYFLGMPWQHTRGSAPGGQS